ncbi:hypothetical protein [Hydrogenophaga sp. ZJX-1]|uniref:hypothetical protein n=1 Tax=Hydrogenophaga sp. ZJX-1 TaxID=3404778 RepID=UPI003B28239F
MRTLDEAGLLDLWERGQDRHPIDRALLLCAWARPDVAPERFAQLPLGVVNTGLLRMRAALFGARVEVQLDCEHCGEHLELGLDINPLLADATAQDERADIELQGFRFRVPHSRDLAALAHEPDARAAALHLLERCCVARPDDPAALADVLSEAEEQLEAADPLADLRLSVACESCGQTTQASLDAGSLLWDDVHHQARSLLGQVHSLAQAYGWTEGEVLALSPARRAAYLDLLRV